MSAGSGAEQYDVAIVGASTAGCTAARLFAQRGARVALIERRPSLDAHKTVCTHFIQSSATPTIEKLGLAPLLEQRGAVHNSIDVWTPSGGWIVTDGDAPYGYSVTRRALDPLLRKLAADTPGVELISGLDRSRAARQRPPGGRAHRRSRTRAPRRCTQARRRCRRARLEGRALGGRAGRVKPHGRFFYWGYWRGLRPVTTRSKMWLLDPDAAYTFPNEDDLTVVLLAPHRDRLPEFHADLHGAYGAPSTRCPMARSSAKRHSIPNCSASCELPNVFRPAARPGLAFTGDAALAGDPLWGVGCGWAFQSADWLVEETADALGDSDALDRALERYRRVHRRRLLPHYLVISDLASGRPISALERSLYRAAARDSVVRSAFEQVGTRNRPPTSMLKPHLLARIARPRERPRQPDARRRSSVHAAPARTAATIAAVTFVSSGSPITYGGIV